MSSWSEGYLANNGFRLHYYRTGGDKPPLVINHGATDDGLCWTRLAKDLEADYDLILPDARGHGRSTSGKGDYSAQARVEDLKCIIQELGIERPVIGGHSMGADTCLHFAASFPEMTRGIFLEDPPIVLPGEGIELGQQSNAADNIGRMMARTMLVYKLIPKFIGISLARKRYPSYPDEEIFPWIDSKKKVSFNFLNALSELAFDPGQAFESFKKASVPILLLTGDQEKMAIMSQKAAQEAVKKILELK